MTEPAQSADYERESVPAMPRREPGAWMNSSREDATEVGCKTCGWYLVGPYKDVRQQWIDHQHDPIIDIEERVFGNGADVRTLMVDIEYLLWRLEQATTHNDGQVGE